MLHNDKKHFARLIVFSQSRKIDLWEILLYSLGAVSCPFARTLSKTNKSALLDLFQSRGEDCCIDHVPANGAIIFVGMSVIQTLHDVPSTSGELADIILLYMIKLAEKYKCTHLDFVIDWYSNMSIKNVKWSH